MPRKDSETLPADFLTQLQNNSPPVPSSPNQKPKITPPSPSSDLLSRLNAFLPAISAANRDLESEIAAGTISSRNIENVDETKDEAYIEMNLGLGVLKELKPGEPESSESESDSGDEGDEREEGDVLAKLLNGNKRQGKPGIQEVEEGGSTATGGEDKQRVDTEMEDVKETSKAS